jgi:hypothetical protein
MGLVFWKSLDLMGVISRFVKNLGSGILHFQFNIASIKPLMLCHEAKKV